jgi:hypothetical protein
VAIRVITCDACGVSFEASHGNRKRCSDECALAAKNAYMATYARDRRSEKSDYDRAHYAKTKDVRSAQKKAYYDANLPRYRAYYERHKDAQLRRNAERRKANPDEHRQRQHRRRAAMYGAAAHQFPQRSADRARNRVGGICEYCLSKPGEHWDHRVPLIRGGSHGEGNLTLACAFCNLQKHAKTVSEWRVWRRRAGLPELAFAA